MKTSSESANCGRVIEQLDPYLDHELAAESSAEIAVHLEDCESCRKEAAARTHLRDRIRSAVRATAATDELRQRIAGAIRAPMPSRAWTWPTLAAGMAAAIILGGTIAYQLGHLRMTTASQERYIAGIYERVGVIMRAGLGDHVHCAVFRKYPTQVPPPETIAADMGPEYAGLVKIIRDVLPPGERVVMAHRCSYHRRTFVHIAMIDGTHLSSLVIARRQPGETFNGSELVPALSDAGLPVYHDEVQRFQIDGFQTSAHLVYLISDLPRDATERMFAKMSRPVRDFLQKLES